MGAAVLLRERPFRRYWAAQTISMFGDQTSSVALPLTAVLVLHTGAAGTGYLTALVWVPSLLFAVHAGGWVDRRGHRRRTMIVADLGRFALLASVPACYAAGVLTLAQLYAVAFGVGTLSVFFAVSDSALFVSLVAADRYVEGQSLVYGSRALSFVGGPSVGGILVQVLTAPFAVAADALSFLGSALFLGRVAATEPTAEPGGRGALTAGLRFTFRTPIIRASLAGVATINFFNLMFEALFIFYVIHDLRVRPALIGLVLGAAAVGGVLGSLLARRLAARIGVGRAYMLGCALFTAPLVLVPLAVGPGPPAIALLFAAEFGSGFGVMILDISIGSIFAVVIPDRLRSRVSGAFQAVNYGARPLGALLGGTLAALIGVRPTLWIAVAGGIVGCLWLLPSPLPHFRMPSAPALSSSQAADSLRDHQIHCTDVTSGGGVEYFVYGRDRPGAGELRSELGEAHWAFMDQYDDELIARGPTLTADGEGATGSLHIVDLPDLQAVQVFAFDEPNYKAGVYDEVLVRRWTNTLGRTMWQYGGSTAGYHRFLIIAHGGPGVPTVDDALSQAHRDYLDDGYRERLIAFGPLLSDDGAEWRGTAILAELPDRPAAETLIAQDPYARAGLYDTIEVHDWEFGGRR